MSTTLYARVAIPTPWGSSADETGAWFSVKDAAREVTCGADVFQRQSIADGLSTTVGTGTGQIESIGTVDGPTAGKRLFPFFSRRLDRDVTISGTITFNICARESSMSANATLRVQLYRVDSQGALSLIIDSTETGAPELTTSKSRHTWTGTPTSTNMKKGDRIMYVQMADDASGLNMGGGYNVEITHEGSAANLADSNIVFTETWADLTTEPTGTSLYLRATDSSVTGEKVLSPTQGSGTATAAYTTVAGPLTFPGQRWTLTAGGTAASWMSEPLQAFTLGGMARIELGRAASAVFEQINTAPNMALVCEIAVCDGDGSNPAIWSRSYDSVSGASSTTHQHHCAGPDLTVTTGQRIRLRIYADDEYPNSQQSGTTRTIRYDGTSTYASRIVFTQTITEVPPGVTASPGVGAVALTGLAPTATVTQNRVARPGVGAVALGGLAPTVIVPVPVATYYVDVASATGGTGLTPATSGTDRAFHGLNEALDALSATNWVSANQRPVIVCGGSTADTTGAHVTSAWAGKLDATHYLTITTNQPNALAHSTSHYRLELTDVVAFTHDSGTTTRFVRIVGLHAYMTVGADTGGLAVFSNGNATAPVSGGDVRWESCRAECVSMSPSRTSTVHGFYNADTTSGISYTLTNCVALGFTGAGATHNGLTHTGMPDLAVANFTSYNNAVGYEGGGSGALLVNCGAASCATPYTGTWSSSSDHNATPNGSGAPGTNPITNASPSFANGGAGDLHLTASDTAWKDQGTSLANNSRFFYLTRDGDGATRSGTWDVGADEVTGVAGEPGTGALTITGYAPTVLTPRTVTPGTGAISLAGFRPGLPKLAATALGALTIAGCAPTVTVSDNRLAAPPTGVVSITGHAPTVHLDTIARPGVGAVDLTGLAPTARLDIIARPGVGAVAIIGYAPTVTATDHRTAAPGLGEVVIDGQAPTVTATANVRASPGVGAVVLTGLAPLVTATAGAAVEPGVGEVALGGQAPTVTATANVRASPDVGALALTGLAPTVTASDHRTAAPGLGVLAITGYAPTVTATAGVTARPDVGAVTIAGLAPTVLTPRTVTPDVGALTLAGLAPAVGAGQRPSPAVGAVALAGLAPTVSVSANQRVTPALGALTITGHAPTVIIDTIARPGVGAVGLTGVAPTVTGVVTSWGVPKVGSPTTVDSGDVAPAEPAGIAQGDLMVACIAYRSNVAFSLPSGNEWSLVATQQSSGDTDSTNGIASGLMAWCIRGASAPNRTFTRTGGDQAIARIIAYTGPAAAPYQTGTANTLGSNSPTATTGTLTTTAPRELLVAMTSAGDALTASAFRAATDPSEPSAANPDTTTPPTLGAWLERADSSYSGGADGALAIADAVREFAGATGAFSATITASARHVMIVGAFRIGAPKTRTPAPGALTITGYAPTVTIPGSAQASPGVGALTITGYAPTVLTPRLVTPGVGQVALGGLAPSAIADTQARPGVGALTLAGLAPTVQTPRVVEPGVGTLALSGYAPTVTATAGVVVEPGTGAVALGGLAPTVIAGSGAQPGVGALTVTGYAPTVTATANRRAAPGVGAVVLTGLAPTALAPRVVTPGVGALAITGYAPTVTATAGRTATPDTGAVVLTGLAPTASRTAHVWARPTPGAVTIVGYAPTVSVSDNRRASPGVGALGLVGHAPLAIATADIFGWRVEMVEWEGPRVAVDWTRGAPRYDVVLWDGLKWTVALDLTAEGSTMDDLAPLNLPLGNDWTGITKPITGVNGTTGATELLHTTVTARIVATSGSDTPMGALEVTASELGSTARYGITFTAAAINAALGALADGATVYRVLSATGFRVEMPVRVRKVRTG